MKFRLLIVAVSLMIACEKEKVYEYKTLIGKTIEKTNATALSSGGTKYILAFNDGHTESTTFGVYTCLKIKDTVKFERKETSISGWRMYPNCK